MISKTLSISNRYSDLEDILGPLTEFGQVLYMLLVVHSDDWGKLQGDASTVKALVVPRSKRSVGDVDLVLDGLHKSELIYRWRDGSHKYIKINKFEAHQVGLHKRTDNSKIPNPPDFPGTSGNIVGREGNRREPKRTEVKGRRAATTALTRRIPARTGQNPPTILDTWKELWATRYPGDHYAVNARKHTPMLQKLEREYGREEVVTRAIRYLDADDEFIVNKRHPLELFVAQWNTWGVKLKRISPRAKAMLESAQKFLAIRKAKRDRQ